MIKEEIRKYVICDMCGEDTGGYYYKTKVNKFEFCYNCADILGSSLIFLNKHILKEAIQFSFIECLNDLQKEG